tara:strand:- start:63 stop:236 length:174 start_codon:yes stop_codon:yes gene_type:complete
MIKLIILGLFLYLASKAISPIIRIIKLNQSIKKKNQKEQFHKKISKMDIQDAEYEEN